MEEPGSSFFLRDGDRVFHTYSTYGRGAEMTGGSYYFLDLTALGRQEDWEEPNGRADSASAPTPPSRRSAPDPDGFRPDRFDLVGASLSLVGVAMDAPRPV